MSTSLADWQGAPAPTVQLLEGRFIRLENSTRRATPTVCGKPSKARRRPKLWDYCHMARSATAPRSMPG